MMHRKTDWETRLAAYLEPLRALPFEWGRHDCCTFAAGAVEAMTGIDPMPEFRGRYRTAIGSARALKRFGAGTLEATLDTKFERIAASLAQRGDIVMSQGSLGLAWGAHMIAVGSEGAREGLVRIARAAWIDPIAWRVQLGG
ncbi:hypothetical protein CLG96_00110 [Sphingomonas oleivorans]|uniref:DUF6950 domain-containing protein n=1 Tax=Sphingomonas oleivorans TaxID=1735121 RepID=A0A2T5G3B9_9SPHN|nr:hypothetical protein [Sphingomonas oleivorans]PTQ13724.1 hypothetical protein CLG96_00110 [Sphingomonas oleivorans]